MNDYKTTKEHLDDIVRREELLQAEKFRAIEKGLKSTSPEDMVRASELIKKMEQGKGLGRDDAKSFFIDPLQFASGLGYKDKSFSLSYRTLARMAKTPIINSIIKTRKNQVADFAEPQQDKYSTGFVIRKKSVDGEEAKMDKQDKKIANAITDFLLRGGMSAGWDTDDFDTFIRKIVEDSLTYDQMTFECIRNNRGQLDSFIAVDASTFRIAESFYDKDFAQDYGGMLSAGAQRVRQMKQTRDWGKPIDGYYPAYVQIYQNAKVSDFYPWELCFAVRNPSTSIYSNGYGVSELEDLVNIVTAMLWGDEYNRRFFSQGSAPKGMLRIKGVNSEAALEQFKQQWQSMITGVMQAWKTPVVDADVEWIDLQKNNRDMEYNAWMEYLIKLACAVYSIDPTEIGWDISRSSGGGLFEGSQAQRLQHSKDKGLYPLLKFLQRKINKYIVEQIHPDFEFCFMGLNGMTIEDELKMNIDKVNSFVTVNEIRAEYGLKPIEGGDSPNNSAYLQAKNAEQQAKMQEQAAAQQANVEGAPEEGEEGGNAFDELASLIGGYSEGEGEGEEEDDATDAEDDAYDEESDDEGDSPTSLKKAFLNALNEFGEKEEIIN